MQSSRRYIYSLLLLFLVTLARSPLTSKANAQGADPINLDDVSLSDLLNIKVESASKQAEPWAEAPVPVTVITKDMIKDSGMRTLSEVVGVFVPGYTDNEDRNESQFGVRGIYATAQQKVLILINGHRLNSRSYLASMPDYGIALHNIERIEVLRGPGSSLYGNVALGGVINLITKKGKDLKKSIEVGLGNHGQQKGRFLAGDGGDNWDLTSWGQWYRASGEVHKLEGNEKYNTGKTGRILIDGVEETPAHDFGFNYRKDQWSVFAATRKHSYIEPYGTGNIPYDYAAFRTFGEMGPGLKMDQQNLGVKYDRNLGNDWSFQFNPYYDHSRITATLASGIDDGTVINWLDQDFGFITHANKNYSLFGGGSVLFGLQLDYMEVTDSMKIAIVDGDFSGGTDTHANRLLEPGGEVIYSGFIQNKHKLSDQWILNFGARYDHKNRRTGDDVSNFSPRLAGIFLPNETWEFKLSYSQSFVDAPYWYRYNKGLAAFGGSEALTPEVLQATQLQGVWNSTDRRLRNAATVYYQKGKDQFSSFRIHDSPTIQRCINPYCAWA